MWHFVTSKQQKCLNQQRNNHETPTIWPYQENDHEIIGYYIRDTSLIFYGAEFNVASVFFFSIVGVFAGFCHLLLPVQIGFLLRRWINEEGRLRHFKDKVKLFGFVCYIYLLSLSCSTGSLLCTSQCYWCVLILISVELILAIVNFCYWCVLTFNFSGTDPSNFEFLLRHLLHLCRKL